MPSGSRREQATSSTMTGLHPSVPRQFQSPPLGASDVRRVQSQGRNCSSSSIVHPSAFSGSLSFYAACCRLSSFSFLHKFSFVCAVWVSVLTATVALQPPLRSTHRANKAVPACPASSTQFRLKRSTYSGRPLVRKGHASMAHHLPGRTPSGGLRPALWGYDCSLVSDAESMGGSFLTRSLLPCCHRHRSRWSRWRWQSRKPA